VKRNEALTRQELVDPALTRAGWVEGLVEREYAYRAGRIRLLGEHTLRDEPQFIDYILRARPHGPILAVIEAKDEGHAGGAGLQQALAYATEVGAPFAWSTNGSDFWEQDLRTGSVRRMTRLETPEELEARWLEAAPARGPQLRNRRGELVKNPLLQPAFSQPGALPMRYYQERAVAVALEQMLAGHERCLLTLATGTGKTFIAFSAVWKLLSSGYAKKVLFLADRVSLRDQAYNEFWPLGERRAVVASASEDLPLHRDVHFAIYQGLWAEHGSGRLFESYPRDYFDVVIVDECHRSGYGDWGGILQHFESAFHLGLTATPKRDDSIDTYAFFGSETPDAEGRPGAAYEYSLGRGMDDGFLATYKVIQVETNVDQDGLHVSDEVERGAELIVPEGVTPADVYEMRQFEREIVIPDRTRALCEHLAGVLRRTGVNDKTMIFCVTMEHADLVRQEMQRLLGPETGKNLYAARIVSEERDGQAILEQFQDSSSSEPVVATTVDLLTTGVNAPAVKNVVFMKSIGSTTVFKQIIGRGSRLDAQTGKTFFRIIDYTRATRLLDAWDQPPLPPTDGPTEGESSIVGRVVAAEGHEGIAASVTARLSRRLLAETRSEAGSGSFALEALPAVELDVYTAATGYARRVLRVDAGLDEEVLIELQAIRNRTRLQITGVEVVIGSELEMRLGNGNELSAEEYLERVRSAVKAIHTTDESLVRAWVRLDSRRRFREGLHASQVTSELLELVLARNDVDELDLLRHAAFRVEMRTREQRANDARAHMRATHPNVDPEFVDDLLDKYLLTGVDEIGSAEIFSVPPFTTRWGGLRQVVAMLGGAETTKAILDELTRALYETGTSE